MYEKHIFVNKAEQNQLNISATYIITETKISNQEDEY
jgi:hypothetical protein